jgi:hypothetical protein
MSQGSGWDDSRLVIECVSEYLCTYKVTVELDCVTQPYGYLRDPHSSRLWDWFHCSVATLHIHVRTESIEYVKVLYSGMYNTV